MCCLQPTSREVLAQSQDYQKQWSVGYLLEGLYAGSVPKAIEDQAKPVDRRKSLKKAFFREQMQDEISECHHTLWPGMVPEQLLPVKTGKGELAGRMPERTIGTGVVIASLFWAVSNAQKRGSTVSRAHAILKDLCRMLACDGNWQVVISDLQHFAPRQCVVASDGCIRGECLWGHCGGRHERCRFLWQQMLAAFLHCSPQVRSKNRIYRQAE